MPNWQPQLYELIDPSQATAAHAYSNLLAYRAQDVSSAAFD